MFSSSSFFSKKFVFCLLFSLLILSAIVHFSGIKQDLPYSVHPDETHFTNLAVNIVKNGNLNPHWFGHPGSTIIYPLAAIIKIHHTFFPDTYGSTNASEIGMRFDKHDQHFYYLGRSITIGYAVATLLFVFLVGQMTFGNKIALIGTFLSLFYITSVEHAQLVRTDSAALFFGMLALWRILKLHNLWSVKNQILAGLTIGLAISSRYFMAALIPVMFLVSLIYLVKTAHKNNTLIHDSGLAAIGGLTIIASFLISTPYFLLDFTTVLADFKVESRSVHAGADGLSPIGNFWYYFSKTLPENLGWIQICFFLIGFTLAAIKKNSKGLILLAFFTIFMIGTCHLSLHWDRWLIQIFPICGLFAAYGLWTALKFFTEKSRLTKFNFNRLARVFIFLISIMLVSIYPITTIVEHSIASLKPSTKRESIHWIKNHVSPNSKFAFPMGFEFLFQVSDNGQVINPLHSKSFNDYLKENFKYIIIDADTLTTYLQSPKECAFYHQLISQALLVKEIKKKHFQNGKAIKIFNLQDSTSKIQSTYTK